MADALNQGPQSWVTLVTAGDFDALPEGLNFTNCADLAGLIDGVALTGAPWKCRAILKRAMRKRREEDHSGATALDLWIALFEAHRSHRDSGTWPDEVELWTLDFLALELRVAWLALTPSQRAGIMAAMRETVLRPSVEAGHE